MEGFLNKLMNKPALLTTDRINPKMEKFLNGSTFQKMYDASTVLQDMSNISAKQQSQPNKNIPRLFISCLEKLIFKVKENRNLK